MGFESLEQVQSLTHSSKSGVTSPLTNHWTCSKWSGTNAVRICPYNLICLKSQGNWNHLRKLQLLFTEAECKGWVKKRLYTARMPSKYLAPNPENSFSEGDKAIPDFSHFGQPHLSHQDNLLSKVLLNDYKNYGIWLARLEQLAEMILVYACEYK